MTEEKAVEQHSLTRSVLLHLLPGFLIGAGYFALTPLLRTFGYPSIMALMCSLVLILLPFELGYLLYQAKKKNGSFSLRGVVLYRNPIPTWQYFVWVPALFVVMGLIFTLMKPVDAFLQGNLLAWLPGLESGLEGGFSQGALIQTYVLVAVFGAVLAPLVEELYFRGYLLPRMAYAGKWSPLLHSLLFGLYHFWTPWMFVTRTLGMLPLVFAVQRRNLNIGIIVHILVNFLDVITGVVFIIGMSQIA
jgi:membrane protease YdiL (CAAX protease family)